MSVQTDLEARVMSLRTVLNDSNTAITGKGGMAAANLSSLPAAIAELSGGSGTYQEKSVTPTGKEIVVVADSGYDALSKVTVAGDDNLKPWNLPEGITIYGVVGTAKLSVTTDPPADLPVSKDDSDAALAENDATADTSAYDLMVLVQDDGNITYCYLAKDTQNSPFVITGYDPITTEFKAKGWRRLSYHTTGEQAGTWTYDDFTDTESGGWNYLKNIRSCSREKLYYNGYEVWPERYETVFDSDIKTVYKGDDDNGFVTATSVLSTDEPLITKECSARLTVDGVSKDFTVNFSSRFSTMYNKTVYYYEIGNEWLGDLKSASTQDDGYDFLFYGGHNITTGRYIVWIYSRMAGTYHVKLEIKS